MKQYKPRGPQAINPQAMFWMFPSAIDNENAEREDATIVTIRGPISQHGGWFDSYESIRRRVSEACAKAAPVVVLRIDSPGGEVAGLFDAARAIRADCDRAGKRLMVHVEGQCSSAAYALACPADKIMASRTADIGSIGIIAARFDDSAADAMSGHKVALIASGERKTDWNPHVPLDAEELASHQAEVDGLAAEFFELVSTWRSISKEDVAALEAASFRGQAAVNAGLIDELGSFDHLVASLGAQTPGENTMDEKEKEARDALRSIAEDEERSEEEREKARRALAALDDEDEPAGEDDEDEPAGEDDEDEPAGEDDEDDKQARKAGTVSAATAGAIAAHGADVERRLERLEKKAAVAERKRLITAHGGVPKEMAKLLATKPLEDVRAMLEALPKPKKPKLGDAAATATVGATRGAEQGDKTPQLPPKEAQAMRRAMGMESETYDVVERGNVLLLGASKDEEVL